VSELNNLRRRKGNKDRTKEEESTSLSFGGLEMTWSCMPLTQITYVGHQPETMAVSQTCSG